MAEVTERIASAFDQKARIEAARESLEREVVSIISSPNITLAEALRTLSCAPHRGAYQALRRGLLTRGNIVKPEHPKCRLGVRDVSHAWVSIESSQDVEPGDIERLLVDFANLGDAFEMEIKVSDRGRGFSQFTVEHSRPDGRSAWRFAWPRHATIGLSDEALLPTHGVDTVICHLLGLDEDDE